jgi:hypothetical protein
LVFPHNYRTLAGGPGGKGGAPVKYDHARITTPELYNLHTDPSETTNVIQENPDIVAQLQAHATDIRTQLGDRLTQTQGNATREPGRMP